MKKTYFLKIFFFFGVVLIFLASYIFHFQAGIDIAFNFIKFTKNMLILLPSIFILIGLFEVWIPSKTVLKHLGKDSGFRGFLWILILAGTTAGGLYVAFPISQVLAKKGAKLSIIFSYLGFAAIARIPMTIFEASFLGIKFTLVRLIIAVPIVILSSVILGKYLEKSNYQIR
ncbi:MAG: permease [Candidatus Cloacimonetes bacterium]|nr:permease [Candidatus Cloacimonadota bacterium]